ncbi:L,D-transpeptidase family protein [Sphingomonas sp. XXL09]
MASTPSPAPADGRIRFGSGDRTVFTAPDGRRFQIGSLLTLPGRMSFGDSVWNDRGAGAGPIWIRIDLARQLISVFRSSDEIGTAVIVYGSDGKATPTGAFPVLGRERLHRSTLYDADMPYTLWLTRDGVAIHASTVEEGRATHGCVGLPMDFARRLFAVARRGDVAFIVPASSPGDAGRSAGHST